MSDSSRRGWPSLKDPLRDRGDHRRPDEGSCLCEPCLSCNFPVQVALLHRSLRELGRLRCLPPWKSASAHHMPISSIDNPAQAGVAGRRQRRCRRRLGWMTERLGSVSKDSCCNSPGRSHGTARPTGRWTAVEWLGGREQDFGAGSGFRASRIRGEDAGGGRAVHDGRPRRVGDRRRTAGLRRDGGHRRGHQHRQRRTRRQRGGHGCGGVGAAAIAGSNRAGAAKVIAVDIDGRKLATAKKLGATHTVNSKDTDRVEAIRELTGGFGADVVIEAVDRPEPYQQALPGTATFQLSRRLAQPADRGPSPAPRSPGCGPTATARGYRISTVGIHWHEFTVGSG